jgi:hypothetical protein
MLSHGSELEKQHPPDIPLAQSTEIDYLLPTTVISMSTCMGYRANVRTEDIATAGIIYSQSSETNPGSKERLGSCRRR